MSDAYEDEIKALAEWVSDPENARSATELEADFLRHSQAGVWVWHGDEVARELVRSALGSVRLSPLYVGRASAAAQLRTGRARARNTKGSTFRCSLAALLWEQLELRCSAPQTLDSLSNVRLTNWMLEHLSGSIVPVGDRDAIPAIEGILLNQLDPPLNLNKPGWSPGRTRLRRLRTRHLNLTFGRELFEQYSQPLERRAVGGREPCVVIPISRATGKGSARSRAARRRPLVTADRGA